MTKSPYFGGILTALICVAVTLVATLSVADDKPGPALSQPQVSRDAEFAAPPLLLPASNQEEVNSASAVESPGPSDVMVNSVPANGRMTETPALTTSEPAPILEAPAQSHQTHMQVEAEVIMPPAPVVVTATQVAYEPIYKELPVTNHIMHLGARRFARCHRGMMHAKLEVTNPAECNGYCYWVSAQVPACCEGEPIRSGRVGILGRGVVEYRWSCGWTVKVVFRSRGDVVIHYMAG